MLVELWIQKGMKFTQFQYSGVEGLLMKFSLPGVNCMQLDLFLLEVGENCRMVQQ